MNQINDKEESLPKGVVLKEHSYDGIQEYDQRLPKWWLITLYGAIIFSLFYWLSHEHYFASQSNTELIDAKMAQINATRIANSIDVTNDEMFWEMSKNPAFINAGQRTFDSICIACHGPDLKGGIGLNLVDDEWKYGAKPSQIYDTVFNGTSLGMPAQGEILGQKRIAEVVSYVLSKNDEASMRELAAESN